MIVIAHVFPRLQTVKISVRKLSKKHRFRKRFHSQYLKVCKIFCQISIRAPLSCVLIILMEVDLENVSPSVTWNLRGVCWHIDCRWQVSCQVLQEFAVSNSNGTIWKTKNFLSIFCSISGIYNKFQTFSKKRWWS